MICVVVRSGSWLSIPLRLCLLPSSCTVTTDGGQWPIYNNTCRWGL